MREIIIKSAIFILSVFVLLLGTIIGIFTAFGIGWVVGWLIMLILGDIIINTLHNVGLVNATYQTMYVFFGLSFILIGLANVGGAKKEYFDGNYK